MDINKERLETIKIIDSIQGMGAGKPQDEIIKKQLAILAKHDEKILQGSADRRVLACAKSFKKGWEKCETEYLLVLESINKEGSWKAFKKAYLKAREEAKKEGKEGKEKDLGSHEERCVGVGSHGATTPSLPSPKYVFSEEDKRKVAFALWLTSRYSASLTNSLNDETFKGIFLSDESLQEIYLNEANILLSSLSLKSEDVVKLECEAEIWHKTAPRYIKANVIPEEMRGAITEMLKARTPNIIQNCAVEAGWAKEDEAKKQGALEALREILNADLPSIAQDALIKRRYDELVKELEGK